MEPHLRIKTAELFGGLREVCVISLCVFSKLMLAQICVNNNLFGWVAGPLCVLLLRLARTVCIHCIWPYIW